MSDACSCTEYISEEMRALGPRPPTSNCKDCNGSEKIINEHDEFKKFIEDMREQGLAT